MSSRRKFVIALNVIAILIAALSYSMHRSAVLQTNTSFSAVEMQLIPLQTMTDTHHPGCAPSCVVISRSVLGITR
ncbi:hypothetical protein [Herminiimonas fonticola]|uniref:hypothetical protein n=1 Tax=Herminiimonas fonticola TaxID=303380 RepID=UPI00333F499B